MTPIIITAYRTNKDIYVTVAGRGTPSRAWNWTLVLTLGNELSEETRVLTKQEILLERASGGEQEGKETQEEDCSAIWLATMSELS